MGQGVGKAHLLYWEKLCLKIRKLNSIGNKINSNNDIVTLIVCFIASGFNTFRLTVSGKISLL